MRVVLDTNSLIRFFTNDIPSQGLKVKGVLDQTKVVIPEVVFPELEYVLGGQYGLARDRLVKIFRFLVSQNNIETTPRIKVAIGIFEETALDMADCIIASYSLKGKLASFDKKLLKVRGVRGYWKR